MAENFPNTGKETDIQAQSIPNKMYPKRFTPRHIIKMSKLKKKRENLKNKRKTNCCIQGKSLRLLPNFSAETLQARSEWHATFKLLK